MDPAIEKTIQEAVELHQAFEKVIDHLHNTERPIPGTSNASYSPHYDLALQLEDVLADLEQGLS